MDGLDGGKKKDRTARVHSGQERLRGWTRKWPDPSLPPSAFTLGFPGFSFALTTN